MCFAYILELIRGCRGNPVPLKANTGFGCRYTSDLPGDAFASPRQPIPSPRRCPPCYGQRTFLTSFTCPSASRWLRAETRLGNGASSTDTLTSNGSGIQLCAVDAAHVPAAANRWLAPARRLNSGTRMRSADRALDTHMARRCEKELRSCKIRLTRPCDVQRTERPRVSTGPGWRQPLDAAVSSPILSVDLSFCIMRALLGDEAFALVRFLRAAHFCASVYRRLREPPLW